MTKTVYRAEDRGHANHGWLNSYHSFSFGSYYNPARIRFGLLRVFNDDFVAAGMGFGTHPHDNMEIISIPTEGSLSHKDSIGNSSVIKEGDVQIMSAGTGVEHSEFNSSKRDPVKFFQIWIFPKVKDILPRYEQKTFNMEDRKNKFQVVVSPEKEEEGVWINQDAWVSLADLEVGKELEYKLKKEGNGIYVFVVEGKIATAGEVLKTRDAVGINNAESVTLEAQASSYLMVIEVPME